MFSVALREGEHALVRQVDEARAEVIILLIFLDKLIQVNRFVSHVLGALLVSFEAEGVPTLVHIHGAKAKAENIELASLSRTLTIALTIDHLFVVATCGNHFHARLHARALVINHAIGANWCTNIAFGHDKAWWALWEPLLLAFLAIRALFLLTVATPQGKRLFTAFFVFLEELGASEVFINELIFIICKRVSPSLLSLFAATLLFSWLLLVLLVLLFSLTALAAG